MNYQKQDHKKVPFWQRGRDNSQVQRKNPSHFKRPPPKNLQNKQPQRPPPKTSFREPSLRSPVASYRDVVKGQFKVPQPNSWTLPNSQQTQGNAQAAAVSQPLIRSGNPNPGVNMWGSNPNQFQAQMISEICQQVLKNLSSMNLMAQTASIY